jgi:hypothetical protein
MAVFTRRILESNLRFCGTIVEWNMWVELHGRLTIVSSIDGYDDF